MNAVLPFQRLLWKEARVLRNVWLGCAIGVLFLMLVILAIGESTTHSQGYSQAFWVFMVWIPPVYVLAALATMFAGEREEGTLVWLTALSPRLATVFSSRLLFVVVTGIALQVCYGLSALALSQFDKRPAMDAADFQEYYVIMSFLLVESLALGMFWSLQSSRPLNAILYAAISMILVNGAASMLMEALGGRMNIRGQDPLNYAFGFWGWARCLLLLAVMVGNWKLARNWLEGHPWDWDWVGAWWSKRRAAKVAVHTTDTAAFPAEASEPWRRAWQRLRWLEWQGIRSYAWIVLGLALLSCASIFQRVNGQPTFGFSMVICWLVLVVGGLMSWHGEQTQQRFRGLVRLGMSPYALWANKLCCWFIATVLGVAFILGSTAVCWTVLGALESARTQHPHRPLSELIAQMMATPQAVPAVTYVVNYSLAIFLLGFVCAHLLRKTVLSLGVTLIGAMTFGVWFAVCGELGLPSVAFYTPILVWLLWISASALPMWWTEQTTWRISYRRMASLALQGLFPLALLALAAGYRVWEVPTVVARNPNEWMDPKTSLNANSSGALYQVQSDWSQLVQLLAQPLIGEEPAGADLLEARAIYSSLHSGPVSAADIEKRYKFVGGYRERLQELREQTLKITYIAPEIVQTLRQPHVANYMQLLLISAQERLAADDPDTSLRFLQAGARLAGMLNRYHPLGSVQYTANRGVLTTPIHDEMIRWAQHPKQTDAILHRGIQLCAAELRCWQSQPEEIDLARQEELVRADETYLPWERARARKLVDVRASNRHQYLWNCQRGYVAPGLSASLRQRGASWPFGARTHSHLANRAWNYVPHEDRWTVEFRQSVYGLDDGAVKSMHQGENDYRATLARMGVVGYRRLQGALPLSLFDVQHYLIADTSENYGASADADVMNDVWTKTLFGYAPSGFPVTEPQFPPESPYRQPLLWSATLHRDLIKVQGNQIYLQSDKPYSSNNPIRSGREGYTEDWVYPIPSQDPVESAAQPE